MKGAWDGWTALLALFTPLITHHSPDPAGQIKIGDLGLATAQQGLSVVGTPEVGGVGWQGS